MCIGTVYKLESRRVWLGQKLW